MPFTQLLLLKIPSFLLGLLIVGGATLFSTLGLLVVRHFIPYHRLKSHHDVAGAIYGTLGVMYAVLLGFSVIVVWQGFDKSSTNVQMEANCLEDLYRDSQAYQQEFKDQVRGLLTEYVNIIVNEEWSMLSRGQESPRAKEALLKLWAAYSHYAPASVTEQIFLKESVRKLNEAGELRAIRLMDSKTGVHSLLWLVLIAGGVVTISFVFLFGSENLNAQIIMTALLTTTIALILFTILSLDFPFTGDLSISVEPFKQLLR